MRPPLRVEAKVAEELRNWLTSELERLDASNTNPFAHHVVTILLHEDLDIDDEPLSTDDQFDQWGIKTVRRIKPKEKQVKAAVQFLRSAIASEETIQESEIELIVNELVLRIEATKQRLNHRKSRCRDLLGALTINTDNPVQKSVCTDSKGERSYNEVFPSLPGESPSSKSNSALSVNPNNSVWNRSPPGKENNRQVRYKRLPQTSVRKVRFTERAEAEAYSIAAHVFVLTLSEICLPQPEAMEVPHGICSFDVKDGCWRSAFYAQIPTHLFVPQKSRFSSYREISSPATSSQSKPVIVLKSNKPGLRVSADTRKLVDMLNNEAQKLFLPIENLFSTHKPVSYLHEGEPMDPDDLEVMAITSAAKPEDMKKRTGYRSQPPKESNDTLGRSDEIQGALAFPNHHRSFFDNAPTLYPDFNTAAPFAQADVPCQAQAEVNHNSLGAIGSAVPGRDPDYYPFLSCGWSGVNFCSDVVGFAEEQLANHEDKDQAAGASNPGTLECQKKDAASAAPPVIIECGAVGLPLREYSRGLMASSDSGVVSHGAAERTSISPCSEPPLSAPPAFQLPVIRARGRAEVVNGQPDPIGSLPCNANYWDFTGPPSVFPPPIARPENSFAWPEPPRVRENLSVSTPDAQLPNPFVNGEASAPWRNALGESCWDDIQRSLFANQTATASFTFSNNSSFHPSPLHTTGDRTLSSVRTSNSTLLSNSVSFAASTTPIPIAESSCWPTCPSQMISEPQGASYFPPTSVSHFMPSDLSPGMGMETTVAHALQTAYVNSFFTRTPSDAASDLQNAASAFNCADLEHSWLTAADEHQPQVPEPQSPRVESLVRGQTCSKWLENDCDLGNECPFSHPSL